MPLNLQTFKTRALTAVVFVVIMLGGLLWNHWSFFLLFSIIHFGCWIEYQRIISTIDPAYKEVTAFHKYGVMLLGWAIMLWMTNDAFMIGTISLHEIGWWLLLVLIVVLPIVEILFTPGNTARAAGYSLLGLLYISLSWSFMMDLRGEGMAFKGTFLFFDTGWVIPIVLVASIWINDTMAYIVGSFIGKTPLSPISPKKTWEGTIGGGILCIVAVSAAGYFLLNIPLLHLVVISSIAAFIGTIGDLLESKLKRMAGLKDSGQIMPGHGGFLDRFDSLLLATPFVWLYIKTIY